MIWAAVILLVMASYCEAITKCEELRDKAKGRGLIGAFVPQCKADGSFEEKQCWGSTGYCWCVDESGTEIAGTKTRGDLQCPKKAPQIVCQSLQTIIVKLPGWCGPPKCKPDGSFEAVQCCPARGECYCVNRDGKELDGTRQKGKPTCEANHTPCEKARLEALASGPMLGRFIPHCKDDGSFEPVQCSPSSGYCWCVGEDGTKIDNTMVRFKHPVCH